MITYKGHLSWDFWTGCEGIIWTFEADDKSVGWKGTVYLEKDDHLKVFNEKDEVVFEGKLVLDTRTGWKEYPGNLGHGQQGALGYNIHWIQKGWQPNDWARLFIRKEGESELRAELTTDRKV